MHRQMTPGTRVWLFLLPTLLTACGKIEVTPAMTLPTDGGAERFDYPLEGVRLGQGWHRDFGEKTNADCVAFRTELDTGQEQTMSISVVHDHNDTMSSMDISAEVQVQAINYEVSGKASFASQLKTSADSLSFIAYADVKNGAEFAAPDHEGGSDQTAIRLTPHFEALAKRSPSEFKRQCGTAFVAAIFSGAELVAQLNFTETSSDKREDIAASLEGSGWGVSASGSAASTMQSYSESSSLSIRYFQSGGSGNPIPTDQNGFMEAIAALPAAAAAAPKHYEILAIDYRTLANFPAVGETDSNDFHEMLAVSYGRMLTLDLELADILQDEDGAQWRWLLPPGESWASLHELQDSIRSKRKTLIETASACSFVAAETTEDESPGLCSWSDKLDFRNDYDLRLRLPIPSAAVSFPPEYSRKNITDCEKAVDNLLDKEKQAMDGDSRNITGLMDAARYFRDVCVGRNPTAYPALYEAGVADELLNYRVVAISENRCRDDLADPGCLESDQIDDFRKIVAERVSALSEKP